MYCAKNIPEPFRNKPGKASPVPPEMPVPASIPIEAKEKPTQKQPTKQVSLSPLAAFFFLEIFSNKKGDE